MKCPICVKWNDVDFRDTEFTFDQLINHIHGIHDTIPQKEFIARWLHLLFTIQSVIEDGRTLIVVSDVLKSILENEK